MKYFLVKTEPTTYSIADLKRDGETVWDGVHNFAALAELRKWQVGDKLFVYHSGEEKAIVGLAEVVGSPYENSADKRKSWAARVKFEKEFATDAHVSLKQIKESGLFDDFALVRQSRLSVMSCPGGFVDWVRKLTLT